MHLSSHILTLDHIMPHDHLVEVTLRICIIKHCPSRQSRFFFDITDGHSIKLFGNKQFECSLEQKFLATFSTHIQSLFKLYHKDTND